MVPVIVWLIVSDDYYIAFFVFMVAGLSDALDGYLAKQLDAASELGAWLDPAADKIMLVSLTIMFWIEGIIPSWLILLIFSRDLLIVGAMFLSRLLKRPLKADPTTVSKWNTGLHMLLFGFIFAERGLEWPVEIGVIFLIYAVWTTTLISGIRYLITWYDHMAPTPAPARAAE